MLGEARIFLPKTDSVAICLPDEVQVGWCVSEVQTAFVTTLAEGLRAPPIHSDVPIAHQC